MTSTSRSLRAAGFAGRVLDWFDRHGRKSLPWQLDRDPYRIWVAEIMLQQTRVDTVIPYYRNLIARFPDIAALARCDADELLHYWSGLGYYARARNLHAAAKKILAQHDGKFPDRFDRVLALPGIGRSTAGAILALAWGRRHPIVDGNVKRVLTRYHAIAGHTGGAGVEARLWQLAERHTPRTRVADYTQAMMDLGATVCVRTSPRCACCPLTANCRARQSGDPAAYPRAKPRGARPRKSVTMLVIQNHRSELLLVKRPPCGIWGGLWSLPEYANDAPPARARPAAEKHAAQKHAAKPAAKSHANQHAKKQAAQKWGAEKETMEKWCEQQFGLVVEAGRPLPPVKHSFTHFDLDIRPLPATCMRLGARIMDAGAYLWYNPQSPAQVGVPAAVNRILGLFDDP